MTRNYGQLTRCPACDDDLGVPPSREPDGRARRPSLRLELCAETRESVDWQLSLWDGSKYWPPSPRFHHARVQLVYRMCGDGHVFLEHVVTGATALPSWRVDHFDVIATVGGVAAGKSYLMLRTLSQLLTVSGTHVDTPVPPAEVSVYSADWLLEAEPLRLLRQHYLKTEKHGLPMDPTMSRDMLPLEFLAEQVAPGLVQQILEIHKELLGVDVVDERSWGQRIRQPIVRRYQIGNEHVMAAVADLAGESFSSDSIQDQHNRYLLRNYGTLVWVIDPVICTTFGKFLPPDAAATLVPASMRPDTKVKDNTDEVRMDRNHVQRELAETLARLGTMTETAGPDQYLLVCVTKADLVRLCLTKHPLRDLGAEGAVVAGVARYLAEVVKRAGGPYPSIVVDEAAHRTMIGRIGRARHEPRLWELVTRQLAGAIVDHYSDPAEFWDLVHGGAGADIHVPEGEPSQVLPAGRIAVPSLDEHVASSLIPGQGGVLRSRDVIMSALGCGIAYGLGFRQNMDILLKQRWRELRFFLCSPLVEVPVTMTASDERFRPMNIEANFPELNDRSAALSQLLLSMLRRLRP